MVRTVLITGCSDGGLGAALATAFHAHADRYRVFATARDTSKMDALTARGIETLALDVLSDESIQACVAQVARLTGGTLDVLVNNAGSGYNMPVMEASVVDMQKLFDLNVFSVIRATQLFLPLLRSSASRGGSEGAPLVVNNTSVASVMGVPWQSPYSASKAAIASFTAVMRLELQPLGVRVVDLKTGSVKSNFFAGTVARYDAKLPPDSIYGAIRDKVESFMRGDMGVESMDADKWARAVVKDLSKSNPPAQVWRGGSANVMWLSTFLPVGALDGMLKKMGGLDVFEQKLKEESKKSK
jgi:NAD(P)-dependent dehydrogenase (short-subunit alcohol dehydrogenase family)